MPSLSVANANIMDLIGKAEFFRIDANRKLDPGNRSSLGQFMTPASVADFMASLFCKTGERIVLLDPGAGIGSLTAAFVQKILSQREKPQSIIVDAYEIEHTMFGYLESTLEECRKLSLQHGVSLTGTIVKKDFIRDGRDFLQDFGKLFEKKPSKYTHCIMNPPYKKIHSNSDQRAWLREIGIETSNMYAAFLSIAIKMLEQGGELVAIVPRSFCNGLYFRAFRHLFLSEMVLKQLHVFDSRNRAFKDDDVLQENIILHAVKGKRQSQVAITSCADATFAGMTYRKVDVAKVVRPDDSDQYIHLAANEFDQMVVDRMSLFSQTLDDLGIDVCTGPVVDFRLRSDIREQPEIGTLPLIYPGHFTDNFVEWPKPGGRKPNAIVRSPLTERWLMPNGWYVVTRRFTSKEERRRIVAAVHDPARIPGEKVGFENHLDVFHHNHGGLDPLLAKGLAIYLNSSLVDFQFRQFSGHTQVNATDLRMMRYPPLSTLVRLGELIDGIFPDQSRIDAALELEVEQMAQQGSGNPVLIQQKIKEALSILESLGLPKGQQNERSALTLLALLRIAPDDNWKDAGAPLMGITPIMDFIRQHYGKSYAPNTRETIRRQTMHQFMDAGIAIPNPDDPNRSVNSPKWCYQIEPNALALLRKFGSQQWGASLASYTTRRKSLAERYANERKMRMIPLILNGKLADEIRYALQDNRLDATERIRIRQYAENVNREVAELLDAAGMNGAQ